MRRAVARDAAAIVRVRERAVLVSARGYYSDPALAAWASGGSAEPVAERIARALGLVATADGVVVGWTSLADGEVDQLYVDPDHGGTGVACLLYEALEERAREHGFARLTAVASLRSAPVFARFGFAEIEREVREFAGFEYEVVLMAKELQRAAAGRHR